jgi:replicative DNA helicase
MDTANINIPAPILPQSPEAEQSVIGAMLMDREAILVASEIVTGEDFYNRQYGIVFDAMVELTNEEKPVDIITLQNRLREKDVPPEMASLEFVSTLMSAAMTSANVKHYAQIVYQKSTLRKLIRINNDISNKCFAGKDSVDSILEDTEKRIFDLIQKSHSGEFVPIRTIVMNALDKIEMASKIESHVTGIATGFADLDYKTAGLQPSDLILLAARPSMGKTALALNIAQYVAFKAKQCIAIFSLEMSKEQLVNRLFSMEARVDSHHLRTGNLSDAEWKKLIESAGMIGRSQLIIDDTPSISIPELRSKCRKFKLEYNLKMVIIDYLQLMRGFATRPGDSRQQEISDISRSLKAIARELEIPIIALSQLNRLVETRTDHRPVLSDLRDSGAIEQDADVVMFIYRDEVYNPETTEQKGIAEIIIAKQRNGPIGKTELVFLPEYTKFASLSRQQ